MFVEHVKNKLSGINFSTGYHFDCVSATSIDLPIAMRKVHYWSAYAN